VQRSFSETLVSVYRNSGTQHISEDCNLHVNCCLCECLYDKNIDYNNKFSKSDINPLVFVMGMVCFLCGQCVTETHQASEDNDTNMKLLIMKGRGTSLANDSSETSLWNHILLRAVRYL